MSPPPPPERPLRPVRSPGRHLGLALGLGAAIVLLAVVVVLAVLAGSVRGGTALADLRRGDCFTTSRALVADKARRVACAAPHSDEAAGVVTFPAAAGAAYPGGQGILDLGRRECMKPVSDHLGSRVPPPSTEVFVFGPNEAAWENGDRTVVCSLREQGGVKRTGSYLDP